MSELYTLYTAFINNLFNLYIWVLIIGLFINIIENLQNFKTFSKRKNKMKNLLSIDESKNELAPFLNGLFWTAIGTFFVFTAFTLADLLIKLLIPEQISTLVSTGEVVNKIIAAKIFFLLNPSVLGPNLMILLILSGYLLILSSGKRGWLRNLAKILLISTFILTITVGLIAISL